ncbi:hypothetical protein GH714_023811 [Hevea brasiliensis]|uniref:Uncharacterized protein n=1 Tax=Hevea brasiliensis TaxID=3981 RepID=A0A6A6LET6_HEVBR|nr:hypothetical protein GH714_023811 [Hevea brasiliensis]
MSENSLFVDAWMREAQEVSRLVEDIESRIKNGHRLGDNAQSKLLEVGVKLDRLESLLHNPPSKPILTKEETKFRWEMLSDLRLRTRVLAFSLYTSPSTKSVGGSAVANAQGTNNPTKSDSQDHIKPSISKDDPEMLKPLISKDASQSRVQVIRVLKICRKKKVELEDENQQQFRRWLGLLENVKMDQLRANAKILGKGRYILYEDVKSCPSEDVHVLRSILVESHAPSTSTQTVNVCMGEDELRSSPINPL